MTYGHTLCLGTRVNFRSGHVEPASLYEATGRDGRRYSVMVPDICGNVSLLSQRRSSAAAISGSGATAPQDPWDPGTPERVARGPGTSAEPHEVAEPGALAGSVLALLAAAGALRRQRKRRCGR
jgi:hypothetical protein